MPVACMCVPDVVAETVEFVLHLQERLRVRDRRVHLELVSDDTGILQNPVDALLRETRHFLRIEVREVFPIALALVQDRRPAESGLSAFEDQELELCPVVPHGHTPLLIVVANVFEARISGPRAAFFFLRHGFCISFRRNVMLPTRTPARSRQIFYLKQEIRKLVSAWKAAVRAVTSPETAMLGIAGGLLLLRV
jgi:hypothetical protein